MALSSTQKSFSAPREAVLRQRPANHQAGKRAYINLLTEPDRSSFNFPMIVCQQKYIDDFRKPNSIHQDFIFRFKHYWYICILRVLKF